MIYSRTMTAHHTTQVAIVGGGVAGLWLRARLEAAGIATALLERDTLGGSQTFASQGMIHGGIKYTLDGFTTPASETIASMPERWQRCIAGDDPVNLKGTRLLSSEYFMFSDGSVTSRLTTFLGSKSVRGRVDPVPAESYPTALANDRFKGMVYRLQDIVLDTVSLVETLSKLGDGPMIRGTATPVHRGESSDLDGLSFEAGTLSADVYVFSAGAGNERLCQESALSAIRMQRRPLKQVMVRDAGLPSLYAHAVSLGSGAKPRLTITTHYTKDGTPVWYLGGNLAESGVSRTDAAQVDAARSELAAVFPWLDLANASFSTLSIDRAEPAQENRARPDTPFIERKGNTIVCWPTKLTLAPMLGDQVLALLGDLDRGAGQTGIDGYDPVPIGSPAWETHF